MHATRPSTTALWVAFMRGAASLVPEPLVEDSTTEALLPAPWGAVMRRARHAGWLQRVPPQVASFLRGSHVALRTHAIDRGVEEAVAQGAQQLVIVGAGLDARAYRLTGMEHVTVYEVDHPNTQSYKRGRVGALEPRVRAVRFVPADLSRDSLARSLQAAGFAAGRPAVFVLEGLSMYLSLEGLTKALDSLADLAARGSLLLMTYAQPLPKDWRSRLILATLSYVHEPFLSTFHPAEVAQLLHAHAWDAFADEGDPEWGGSDTPHSAFERLVRARRC
ncbi:MAG TPA: SAM-dependent methyltransferase [Myxococcota bacterium]|nr:SAM-dependent methyltransferase [Myxococcota bacterium]